MGVRRCMWQQSTVKDQGPVTPNFGKGEGECLRWKRDETQRVVEQHQVDDGDALVRPSRVKVPLEKADMPLGDRRQRTGFVPGGVLAVRPSTPEKRRCAGLGTPWNEPAAHSLD